MARKNTIEDFFSNIDMRGGNKIACWSWQGSPSTIYKDRGYFSYDGKRWLSYRLMYTLVNGPIPDGMVVRHKCDNSMCCNPEHLELGDQSDNENDKYNSDRAGIPVAAVREIKRLLQTTNATQAEIAAHISERFNYDVSRSAVRNIKLNLRRTSDDARTAAEITGLRSKEDTNNSEEHDTD